MAVLLYKSRSASSRMEADDASERAGIPDEADWKDDARPKGESVMDACGRAAGACGGPAFDLVEEIFTVTSVRRSAVLAPDELVPPRF
jgi:hypothetical protein